MQQIPGMAVTWLDEDRGLFHRNSQLHLCVLDPERILSSEQLPQLPSHLQALLRHSGVADLYVKLDTLVLPGQLRGQAELSFEQGTPAELVTQGALTPTRQELSWQVGGWNKLLQFELESEGIQLHKPNITLTVQPFHLQLEQQPEQRQLSWTVPGLQLEFARRMVELNGISGQLLLTQHQTNWLMPSLQLVLESARLTTTREQLDLQNLALQTSVRANKQGLLSLVDTDWEGTLSAIRYQSTASHVPLQLNSLQLGLQLAGLEQQGLRQLFNELSQPNGNKQRLLLAINRITRSGFTINLSRLAVRLYEGELSAHGALNSHPFDVAQLQNIASLRSLLQGKLNLKANRALTQALLPLQDQLLAMQAAGYLSQAQDRSGNLNSQLQVVNGKLSANGVALPW
ncbi:MAG: hypothetical protein ACRCRW_13325 [Aeromonadaceae bacterium]